MALKYRVYGWYGWRRECPEEGNGSRETREIMSARSKAEVARIAGCRRGELTCLEETGNGEELRVCVEPGTWLWRPRDREGRWARNGDPAAPPLTSRQSALRRATAAAQMLLDMTAGWLPRHGTPEFADLQVAERLLGEAQARLTRVRLSALGHNPDEAYTRQ